MTAARSPLRSAPRSAPRSALRTPLGPRFGPPLGPVLRRLAIAAAASAVLAGPIARAQPSARTRSAAENGPRSILDRARPVRPNVSDTGPLSRDLLRLEPGLRVPRGFERVFELRTAAGDRVLLRRNGAVTAVFPRSVYTASRRGLLAEVPPGTTFIIGDPGPELARRNVLPGLRPQGETRRPSPLRRDTRLDLSYSPGGVRGGGPRQAPIAAPARTMPRRPLSGAGHELDLMVGPVGALLRRAAEAEVRSRPGRRRR